MFLSAWFLIWVVLLVLGYWYFSSRRIKDLTAQLANREDVIERLQNEKWSLMLNLDLERFKV
jgi:hypothetical protein